MKPMLATAIKSADDLKFPLLASPKLDGVRAMVIDGQLISRNGKPIPNWYVNHKLPLSKMEGWDGELIVGDPTDKDVFRNTTSGVMSADGEPFFQFWVFDLISHEKFSERHIKMTKDFTNLGYNIHLRHVPQYMVVSVKDLDDLEEQALGDGYEGLMLRSPNGLYKHGRSSLRDGALLKLKRFADGEAIVIGFEEQMQNNNAATKDAHGYTERSSHKANMKGKDTLGALVVKDLVTNVEFNIGTGLDDATRKDIWVAQDAYLNQIVKYKHFPTGSKDKPRFPVFLGFRAVGDMDVAPATNYVDDLC